MPTTRTPIGRPPVKQIPPEAVAIFKKMMALGDCSDGCKECDEEYSRLDDELRRVLRLKPWQYPTLAWPDVKPVHPPRSGAYEWHPYAQQLYAKLTELAKAAELTEAAS